MATANCYTVKVSGADWRKRFSARPFRDLVRAYEAETPRRAEGRGATRKHQSQDYQQAVRLTKKRATVPSDAHATVESLR
jgi:hypothetical protein